MRVERIALEDHGDVAVFGRDVIDAAVADVQVATADLLEPGDHPQGGALAAARRADEHQKLLVTDLNVQIIDGGDLAVLLADVVQRYASHLQVLLSSQLGAVQRCPDSGRD